jgi:hypothetical protein
MACGVILGLFLSGVFALSTRGWSTAADVGDKSLLAHDVFFALKDNSGDAKTKLVESCRKYLTKHDGEEFFAVGTRAEESAPSNAVDKDFDVAVHIYFKDKVAEEKYHSSEHHKQFVEENGANFKKVRVFDSIVQK